MKFGVAVSTFPSAFGPLMLSGQLPETLPRLAELGFDGVDLFIRRADEPGLVETLAALRACGLRVALLAAVSAFVDEGLFLSSPDEPVRTAMMARMRKQIELAAQLGAFVPIGLLRGREGGADRLKWLAESLFQLNDWAVPLGVRLIVEPVNRYETRLLNSIGEVQEFLRTSGLPPLGLLPDTFHMNIEEVSIEGSLRQCGPALAHLHTADSNRRVPGRGHLAWCRIFAVLREMNYSGFCTMECIPGPDPLVEMRESLDFLRGVIRE